MKLCTTEYVQISPKCPEIRGCGDSGEDHPIQAKESEEDEFGGPLCFFQGQSQHLLGICGGFDGRKHSECHMLLKIDIST